MRKIQIADSAFRAFWQGLVLQGVLLALSALMLDGGYLLRVCVAAMIAQLVTTGVILQRRPTEPTRTDLLMIRFGIVPLAAIAYAAMPWIVRVLQ
ncbi:MAG: hypothetical protein JW888_15345 [Pirellulales bacterium]|nr:hypothetical protein [Pirellulales bacterium]